MPPTRAGPEGSQDVWGHDALTAAQKVGICLEPAWPHAAKQQDEAGPAAADNRARNRIGSYYAVPTRSESVKGRLPRPRAHVEGRDSFNVPSKGLVWPTGASYGYYAVTPTG